MAGRKIKSCPVCGNLTCNLNKEGIKIGETEIIPYVKNKLLQVRYLNHPIPKRYGTLTAICFAYAQVLVHARTFGLLDANFYTDDKVFLEHKNRFAIKFGVSVRPKIEAPENALLVCEFKAEKP